MESDNHMLLRAGSNVLIRISKFTVQSKRPQQHKTVSYAYLSSCWKKRRQWSSQTYSIIPSCFPVPNDPWAGNYWLSCMIVLWLHQFITFSGVSVCLPFCGICITSIIFQNFQDPDSKKAYYLGKPCFQLWDVENRAGPKTLPRPELVQPSLLRLPRSSHTPE